MLSEKLYESYTIVDNAIPDEPLVDRFARETAIHWACQAGNQACLNDTYVQVHLVAHHDRTVPKGLEEVIYCNGLRGVGRKDEWVDMWQKMQASVEQEERSLIIKALGCSDDEEVMKNFLQASIATNSDVNFGAGERLEVFEAALSSSVGVKAALEFLKNHEQDGIIRL